MNLTEIRLLLNVLRFEKSMCHTGLYIPRVNTFIEINDALAVRMSNGKYFVCDNKDTVRYVLSQREWLGGNIPYGLMNGKVLPLINQLYPNASKLMAVSGNDFDLRECNIVKLFGCKFCGESFGTEYYLHRHEKYHTKGRGSIGERKVMDILKNLGIYYVYDKPYKNLKGTKKFMRFDFRIPIANGHNLFIEVDGGHHRQPVTFGGKKYYEYAVKQHETTVKHDMIKNKFVAENGDLLLRLPDNQINFFMEKIDSFILRNSKLLQKDSSDRFANLNELFSSNISDDEKLQFLDYYNR